jgi:hypothetical protein
MAKNYEYEHTHIELKRGYATFLGKDFKPSDELLNALNKMTELAYNECGGLKVNTGGKQLTIPDVSGSFSLDFIKWYSGMGEQKILNAYERYKRESGNDR